MWSVRGWCVSSHGLGSVIVSEEGWLTLQQGGRVLAQPLQGEVYRCLCILEALDPVLRRAPLGEGSQSCLGVGIVMPNNQLWRRSVMFCKREVSWPVLLTGIPVVICHIEGFQSGTYTRP